jgi:hypothetical protein
LNKGGGGREGVEWTKVKYTHSRGTLRNPLEHLFLDLGINNERQYKIGSTYGRGTLGLIIILQKKSLSISCPLSSNIICSVLWKNGFAVHCY